MSLPSDILNLILDYYSQLRDMKWTPFIDNKTGKLTWKVNKYSAKYDNIYKLLEYRKNNPRCDILLHVYLTHHNNEIVADSIIGNILYLNTFHVISVEKRGFEIDDPIMLQNVISSTKYNNYFEYTIKRQVSYVYVEYCAEDSKHFIFCSLINYNQNYKTSMWYSKTHDYYVYQDTNIYSKISELRNYIYNEYLLFI